jgi:cytochrome P450
MWALWEILQDADLLEAVCSEIDGCFRPYSFELDPQKLTTLPLLSSIFMETLRVRVAAPIGRTTLTDAVRIGKWRFPKEAPILSTSWLGGHDVSFWNEGGSLANGQPAHPVDGFWAERFLEYTGNPLSGPVRKPGTDGAVNGAADARFGGGGRSRLVTTGMSGHWYPFGGGANVCPGRHFAKIEIMASVAVILRAFEFEIVDRKEWASVEPDMNYFPFGAIPPKGKMAVRMRRREL